MAIRKNKYLLKILNQYYANEDGVFEEDLNWIEQKKMPQPFPKDDFIYSHKGIPKVQLTFNIK